MTDLYQGTVRCRVCHARFARLAYFGFHRQQGRCVDPSTLYVGYREFREFLTLRSGIWGIWPLSGDVA